MKGRKPVPGRHQNAPVPPAAQPRCPAHLNAVARKEWRRLAKPLHDMGVLSTTDRAALAAYCQCYARWVEAEHKLKETPALIKTKTGYIQQSPWLSIANKQLELMGRYMAELGLTPSARARLPGATVTTSNATVKFVTIYEDRDGKHREGARKDIIAPNQVAGGHAPKLS